MVEFWVVAGAGGSRKTSTIRSLTSSRLQVSVLEVEVNGKKVDMFVQSASPQERKPFQCPQDVVDRVKEENVQHVLIALRHTATAPSTSICKGSSVDASDYVDYFIKMAGWVLKGVLFTSPGPNFSPTLTDHAPSLTPPYAAPNAIANVVRSKWGF